MLIDKNSAKDYRDINSAGKINKESYTESDKCLEKSTNNQITKYSNKEISNEDLDSRLSEKNSLEEQKKQVDESVNIIQQKHEDSKLSYLKYKIQKLNTFLDSINIKFQIKNEKYFINLLLGIYDESEKQILQVI